MISKTSVGIKPTLVLLSISLTIFSLMPEQQEINVSTLIQPCGGEHSHHLRCNLIL